VSARIRFAPTIALASLLAAVTVTQGLAQAAATNTSSYDAEFFSRSQPSSAYDMVQLVPGFRLQEGNADLRGYSGAAGNVLLDGQRPASKEDTLETLLKRIPARSVERIELIRNSAAGVDMQGFALLANVVRKRGSRLTGRLEVEYADFQHGYSAPRIAGEVSSQTGETIVDLQAARYRDIDDEHGFGSRNRYTADGVPLRLDDYAQPEGTTYTEISGSYRQPLAGGSLRASALFKDSRMFADIKDDIFYPSDDSILGTERNHGRATEGELRYVRPVADSSGIELIAIRRDTQIRATDTSTTSADSEINREASDAAETIVRAVFRRKGSLLSVEAGAEGTINTLDSHIALTEDGIAVPLPAADVRVEEQRSELFATGTWRLTSALTAETGLRFETSRLTQSGDSTLVKSLSYLKPRLLVTYTASPDDELRLLAEREVGQLDFADFVSTASLSSGTITAGNKDLVPDSLWRIELAWEHRAGPGSIVLTAREERVSDVVDRVAVISPEGTFDSAGNIGSGRRDEVQLDLNMPLDGLGLRGVTVKGSGLLRRSRVDDPLTGESRRISEDLPVEATAELTHDVPALHLRWGVDYAFRTTETNAKIDEVEHDQVADRIDAFVEYKADSRSTLRLFVNNLTDSAVTRRRLIYTGLRGASDIDYLERRVLRSGRYYGVNFQRAFGG
jgi:outer membrane receptor protein involved in Fe transport